MKKFPALLLTFAALAAQAHDYKLGAIAISHPHARFSVPGQRASGGFVKFENSGGDDRLVGASAPVCERVEMHTMKLEGDVMRMRQIDAIVLPAGKTVELKSGGLHLMFMGLRAPLKTGERFPMTLKFEKAGEVTIEVTVEAPRAEHKH